jgi:hypothetical protein
MSFNFVLVAETMLAIVSMARQLDRASPQG